MTERHSVSAVLWDMDGTLVDTEPYWIEAEFELAAEYGATWSHELALNLVGNDLLTSGRFIRDHMRLPLEPEKIVDRLLDGVIERVRRSAPWRPGALDLLGRLRADGTPCALVTMSYRNFASAVVDQLPQGTFAQLVTGDEVTHGKPHPEPYLTAARLLGVDPAECLAIEDSGTGAASALAAGCQTLVIPNHVPVTAKPGLRFRSSLEGLYV